MSLSDKRKEGRLFSKESVFEERDVKSFIKSLLEDINYELVGLSNREAESILKVLKFQIKQKAGEELTK
ncbi:MAG: hypothetical protein ACP6IY_20955 [Promethearchaeia archaeon]